MNMFLFFLSILIACTTTNNNLWSNKIYPNTELYMRYILEAFCNYCMGFSFHIFILQSVSMHVISFLHTGGVINVGMYPVHTRVQLLTLRMLFDLILYHVEML